MRLSMVPLRMDTVNNEFEVVELPVKTEPTTVMADDGSVCALLPC